MIKQTCDISQPFSVNARGKSKKYKQWMDHHIALFQSKLSPVSTYPVTINITIMEGKNLHNNMDIDNVIQPIINALVRANILVDDQKKYVQHINVSYIPSPFKDDALIKIVIEEI